ncbi:aquaporin [Streptomyces collinus]|uniref:aquaporin n=1 Tax=Streptomyces collinus TaxID=42684 RepID=UPI0033EE38F3
MTNEAPPRRPGATAAELARRATAEAVGTGLLVVVAVGSAIQATRLSQDVGVRLLACSPATALGLGMLVTLLGPVSGGHLNPAVTLSAWYAGRRSGEGPTPREVAAYLPAQTAGSLGGAVPADAMFARRCCGSLPRSGPAATCGWARPSPRPVSSCSSSAWSAAAVPGPYRPPRPRIAAACWFTSSTAFANPATTVGRP